MTAVILPHDLLFIKPTMAHWLSYHIRPLETPDVFLARAVRPFLEKHVWPVQGARAFFVRQADATGLHIRLRLFGEQETLRPAFDEWFAGRGETEETAYQPEPERFGGPGGLRLAEEHFHLSTRTVLDRLNRPYTYGDALYDGLRLHLIAIFAAEFDRQRAGWYFGQLCEQWLPLFFQPLDAGEANSTALRDAVTAQFEQSFAPQEAELRRTLDALWAALQEKKFDREQPEWARWLQGNQLILNEFGENLGKALPSLLHLTANRLGVNNQDEVYLNYVLSKLL